MFDFNACWNFLPKFNTLVRDAFLKSDCFIKRNVLGIELLAELNDRVDFYETWLVLLKRFAVKVGDVNGDDEIPVWQLHVYIV